MSRYGTGSGMQSKIQEAKQSRLDVQTKTFVKWINAQLAKSGGAPVNGLDDLQDGTKLLTLLSAISGESPGKPERGKMRVHKIGNVRKVLSFVESKVHLENISAEDIVDGNHKLMLGLLWTVILRFQIQDISVDALSAKEALLLWCQRKTANYDDVNVQDFSKSWKSGLAFNAIIHKHRPDLINWKEVEKMTPEEALENAFRVAQDDLGIARLLDVDDIAGVERPDDRAVMTYVAAYYHYFSQAQTEDVAGRRVGKVLDFMDEMDRMKGDYQARVTELLRWIKVKHVAMSDRDLPNSFGEVEKIAADFKTYRSQEKPPKSIMKGDLEAHLFTLQTKLATAKRDVWSPPSGMLLSDINDAWGALEEQEKGYEAHVRKELHRLQELEQLATKFKRKADTRLKWFDETNAALAAAAADDAAAATDYASAEANVRKLRATESDVLTHKDRVENLIAVADKLNEGSYRDEDGVVLAKAESIREQWSDLKQALEARGDHLEAVFHVQRFHRSANLASKSVADAHDDVMIEPATDDLASVQGALEDLALIDAEVARCSDLTQALTADADSFAKENHPDAKTIAARAADITSDFNALKTAVTERRQSLESKQAVFAFYDDLNEESAWVKDKLLVVSNTGCGTDLTSAQSLLKKHETLAAELGSHEPRIGELPARAAALPTNETAAASEAAAQLASVTQELRDTSATRKTALEQSVRVFQVAADLSDAESWVKQQLALANREDLGTDADSADALIAGHEAVIVDVDNYASVMGKLNEDASAVPDTFDSQLKALQTQFSLLQKQAAVRKTKLDQSLSMFDFVRDADELDAFVAEKEGAVASLKEAIAAGADDGAEDTANVIQKRGADLEADIVKHEKQMDAITTTVTDLLKADHPKSMEIVDREETLIARWTALKVDIASTHESTTSIAETRAFRGDADKLVQTMQEMTQGMRSQECGKDVPSVEEFQRKHDDVEREIAALESQVKELTRDCITLMADHPGERDHLNEKREGIAKAHRELLVAAADRRERLDDSLALNKLLADEQDARATISDLNDRVGTAELADDLAGAEVLSARHDELKTEVDASAVAVKAVKAATDRLVARDHFAKDDVVSRTADLEKAQADLEAAYQARKQQLDQSCQLHALKRDVDESHAWMDASEKRLASDDTGSTVEAAEALTKKHTNFSKTVPPQQGKIDDIRETGDKLVKADHYAADEINTMVAGVNERWENLLALSDKRASALDAACQQLRFETDADEINGWMDEKLAFANDDSYKDPANISEKMHEQDEFQAELAANAERVGNVAANGDKLVTDGHPSADSIAARLALLREKWDTLQSGCKDRGQKVTEAHAQHEFFNQLDDIEMWLTEVHPTVSSEDYGKDLQATRNLIKQHALVEDDITAHAEIIDLSAQQTQRHVDDGHFDAERIQERQKNVESRYAEVKDLSATRRAKLNQAEELFAYLVDADELDAWISEKDSAAPAVETESDLERIDALRKKYVNLDNDMAANEERLQALKATATRLCDDEKHPEAERIRERDGQLDAHWKALQELSDDRKNTLDDNMVLQTFLRDGDDLQDWINEKIGEVTIEDFGKDVNSVEMLCRRHDAAEHGHAAVVEKVDSLKRRSAKLQEDQPSDATQVKEMEESVDRLVGMLQSISAERKRRLEAAASLQKFLESYRDTLEWMEKKGTEVGAEELATDLVRAEALLKQNKEYREQIDMGSVSLLNVMDAGSKLVSDDHPDKAQIQEAIDHLDAEHKKLDETWTERQSMLEQGVRAHELYRDIDTAEEWIRHGKEFASSDKLGDSIVDVDELSKKLEEFMKTITPEKDKVEGLLALADQLVDEGHYDAKNIEARREALENSWEEFLVAADERNAKLEASHDLQVFYRDVDELDMWIGDRVKVASDENYKEATNLPGKVQKHEVFSADVSANRSRVDQLRDQADGLVGAQHYASEDIKARMDTLMDAWDTLSQRTEEKGRRLREAHELQQLNRLVDEMNAWHSEVHSQLSSEDFGKDLAAVQSLQKKQQHIEADIASHKEIVNAVCEQADSYVAASHFASAEISKSKADLMAAMAELGSMSMTRRNKLSHSEQFHSFQLDADEIAAMISQKQTSLDQLVAERNEADNDVDRLASVLKKLGHFETGVTASEERVHRVKLVAERLDAAEHPERTVTNKRKADLLVAWDKLKCLMADQKRTLSDGRELEVYNREVAERMAWIGTKQAALDMQIADEDQGKDLAGVKALLRRHEGVERDVIAAEQSVRALVGEGDVLAETFPKHKEQVKLKQGELQACFGAYQAAVAKRGVDLDKSERLYRFTGEADEVNEWASELAARHASGEEPKDLSSAEAMLQHHMHGRIDIAAGNEIIERVLGDGDALIKGDHPESTRVKEVMGEIEKARADLQAAWETRKAELEKAVELQQFNRDADQLERWLTSSEQLLDTDDLGASLEESQLLTKKHDKFESQLPLQADKVSSVEASAAALKANGNPKGDEATARSGAIKTRWDGLQGKSASRGDALRDAVRHHQFERDADDLDEWIAARTSDESAATKENSDEAGNGIALAGELDANVDRVGKVEASGKALVDAGHPKSGEISARMATTKKNWEALREQAGEEGAKMAATAEKQQYSRSIDDLELWLKATRAVVASEDFGKDLKATQNLVKKHQIVASDIESHADAVKAAVSRANEFVAAKHFDAAWFESKGATVSSGYAEVQELSGKRAENLQATSVMHTLLRGLAEEEGWLGNKEKIASDANLGANLTVAQRLQKKHQALATEVQARSARVDDMLSRAATFASSGSGGEQQTTVAARADAVKAKREVVMAALATRTTALDESVSFFEWEADASEELAWCKGRRTVLASADTGDTLAATQGMMKQHVAVELELSGHKKILGEVTAAADKLVANGHSQKATVSERQSELTSAMGELDELAAKRKQSLNDAVVLHSFTRSADAVTSWTEKHEASAQSTDEGSDLGSVELLLEEHDKLEKTVASFSKRVDELAEQSASLKAGGHSAGETIAARFATVQERFTGLQSATKTRRAALDKSHERFRAIDASMLDFAKKAAAFSSWLGTAEEDLSEPVRVNSLQEVTVLEEGLLAHQEQLEELKRDVAELERIDTELVEQGMQGKNPYTPFTMDLLTEKWNVILEKIDDRIGELDNEAKRQEDNEELRQAFADKAAVFDAWATKTRVLATSATGTLEDQLASVKGIAEQVASKRADIADIEETGAEMEAAQIYDNEYTEHTSTSLAQAWEQLDQLCRRLEGNLMQQIKARDSSGVSDEKLKEYRETFAHFDKNGDGTLDATEFCACLRTLGYDYPGGQENEDFKKIMAFVDSNHSGTVGLAEYNAYMISLETENADRAEDVAESFSVAAEKRPYVTKAELYKTLPREQADYCIANMDSFDGNDDKLDYKKFTDALFGGAETASMQKKREAEESERKAQLQAADDDASAEQKRLAETKASRAKLEAEAAKKSAAAIEAARVEREKSRASRTSAEQAALEKLAATQAAAMEERLAAEKKARAEAETKRAEQEVKSAAERAERAKQDRERVSGAAQEREAAARAALESERAKEAARLEAEKQATAAEAETAAKMHAEFEERASTESVQNHEQAVEAMKRRGQRTDGVKAVEEKRKAEEASRRDDAQAAKAKLLAEAEEAEAARLAEDRERREKLEAARQKRAEEEDAAALERSAWAKEQSSQAEAERKEREAALRAEAEEKMRKETELHERLATERKERELKEREEAAAEAERRKEAAVAERERLAREAEGRSEEAIEKKKRERQEKTERQAEEEREHQATLLAAQEAAAKELAAKEAADAEKRKADQSTQEAEAEAAAAAAKKAEEDAKAAAAAAEKQRKDAEEAEKKKKKEAEAEAAEKAAAAVAAAASAEAEQKTEKAAADGAVPKKQEEPAAATAAAPKSNKGKEPKKDSKETAFALAAAAAAAPVPTDAVAASPKRQRSVDMSPATPRQEQPGAAAAAAAAAEASSASTTAAPAASTESTPKKGGFKKLFGLKKKPTRSSLETPPSGTSSAAGTPTKQDKKAAREAEKAEKAAKKAAKKDKKSGAGPADVGLPAVATELMI